MLVDISFECTDIPLRENKNQGQTARDRKILIFRILLLQSVPDSQADTLICPGFLILNTQKLEPGTQLKRKYCYEHKTKGHG